ncbi:cAMP-dependent protein kinase inhibitor beta isoform X2 [Mustela lutreola]|nr:cAMP-dependent protein kinase inhibitor beta isoform X2 [Mustela lutreola]
MRTDSSEMTDVESVVNNFASSARTGRRNAVPDIQGSAGMGGSAELPLKLEALSMKEANRSGGVCFAIVFYEPFYVSDLRSLWSVKDESLKASICIKGNHSSVGKVALRTKGSCQTDGGKLGFVPSLLIYSSSSFQNPVFWK